MTDIKPCSLGPQCACARLGQALRFIAPCPQGEDLNPKHAWLLAIPLATTLSAALVLSHYRNELGAIVGAVLGLVVGFLLLRIFKF